MHYDYIIIIIINMLSPDYGSLSVSSIESYFQRYIIRQW